MPTVLETLEIQFKANAGNAKSEIKSLESAAKKLRGGELTVTVDTKDADSKLKQVAQSVESLPDGETEISGDNTDALSAIDETGEAAQNIPDGEVEISGDGTDALMQIDSVQGAADSMTPGEVTITADAETAKSDIKAIAQDIQSMQDGEVSIGVDSADALTKVQEVQGSVSTLRDGEVSIAADAKQALSDIGEVADTTASLQDKDIEIKVETKEAEGKITSLKDKADGLVKLMKTAGLVAVGKKIVDFAMDSIEAASDAQQTGNKVINLMQGEAKTKLDQTEAQTAYNQIAGFASEMNSTYGLNMTGLMDMTASFAGVYKGMNLPLDKATDYAINLSKAAIDYASVLNKTPGEVADIFMSMMKGNTSVADNVAIFGLTAEALDKKVAEMEAGGQKGMFEGMEDSQKKFVAMMQIIQENGDKMGFTGDWSRTSDEYANQTTLLSEQWKTLQEQAGSVLLPAATTIVNAMNDILGAINGFIATSSQSTFVQDMSKYFGDLNLASTDISAITDGVTSTVDEVTKACSDASAKLDSAEAKLSASYKTLSSTIAVLMSGGQLEESDKDGLVASVQGVSDQSMATVKTAQSTMIGQLTAFFGTDAEWADALSQSTSMINGYFDGVIQELDAKADELGKAVEEALNSAQVTPEQLANIQALAQELAQAAYTSAEISVKGKQQRYLDDLAASGQLSGKSIEDLIAGMDEATTQARADLDAAYNDLMDKTYAAAIAQGVDPKEATDELRARHDEMVEKMDISTYDTLAKTLGATERNAIAAQSGDVQAQLKLMSDFVDRYDDIVNGKTIEGKNGEPDTKVKGVRDYAAEGKATPEMLKIMQMYDAFATMYLTPDTQQEIGADVLAGYNQANPGWVEQFGQADFGQGFTYDRNAFALSYANGGFNLPQIESGAGGAGSEEITGSVDAMSVAVTGAVTGLVSPLNAIVSNTAKSQTINLTLGGYSLASATSTSANTRNRVRGGE